LARERAQQFDAQAALDRKTNEALKLAKAQAHIHDVDADTTPASTSAAPLVDRESFCSFRKYLMLMILQWTRMN